MEGVPHRSRTRQYDSRMMRPRTALLAHADPSPPLYLLCAQYFIFIAIITIILFAVGIAVYVKRDQASVYISQAWKSAEPGPREALQLAYYCCGLTGAGDDAVLLEPCNPAAPSTPAPADGCLPLMEKSFNDNFQTAGSCGIAFSCVMVVSLLFTAYLMVGIRETAVNAAISKNRERNERDMAKGRKKGKGLKIPTIGADVL